MKATCKLKQCYIVYKWNHSIWLVALVFHKKKLALKFLKEEGCKYNRKENFYYIPALTKEVYSLAQYTISKVPYYVEK